MRRWHVIVTAVLAVVAVCAVTTVAQQRTAESRDMTLLGSNDLQARSAYQPVIQKQGNRYIAYVGHHGGTQAIPKPVNPMTGQAEFNGTSIIEVTDPAHPK